MKKITANWRIITAILLLSLCLIAAITVEVIFDVPSSSRLASSEKNVRCQAYSNLTPIDVSAPLRIAVWNIYKQQLAGWESELVALSQVSSLILLQEAQSSSELLAYIAKQGWHSNQAFAFAVNGEIAGVMTLSDVVPNRTCAYTKIEPYLRLPKSALYTEFALSNGQILAVINIHSINFTYGIEEYRQQLRALVDALSAQQGPVIIAGDFNTWSEQRLLTLQSELTKIGLAEVTLTPDVRLNVFGLPLDYIFYRGLKLDRASSKETDASDHNMMYATFSFLPIPESKYSQAN